LPEDNSGDQAVVVPEMLCLLNEATLTTFMDMISRLVCTDPWDTEPYINSLQILDSLVVDAS
jgi:hypothetical protein